MDKAKQRNIPLDKLDTLYDIAGLRVTCQFVDDIKRVVQLFRNRNDLEVVEEKDYITNKKSSGYRSYHLIIRYPVQTIHGEKNVLVKFKFEL